MCALRKVSANIEKKVEAATNLVFSNCYDIGLVYAYADHQHFRSIGIAIRRVLKAAGLDHLTDSVKLHQATTKMSPVMMAKKQILQLGIKFLNQEEVRNDRYRAPIKPDDHLRPFWGAFLLEFNGLKLNSRKFIIDNLNVREKAKMAAIKNHLRDLFVKWYNPDGLMSDAKRLAFLKKNRYAVETVKKRKADYEQRATLLEDANKRNELARLQKLTKTPIQRRKKNSTEASTPLLLRKVREANAPLPKGPPAKLAKLDSRKRTLSSIISTPIKDADEQEIHRRKRPRRLFEADESAGEHVEK
jgi:hypothetical protein